MPKLTPLIALSLICLNAKSQVQHTNDTIVCNGSAVILYASGAYSYTWATNGHTVVHQSNSSAYLCPFNFSSWVILYALTDAGVYQSQINVSFTECVGINENEPNNQVQPVYFDLTGNKAEPIQGQILIEQRGIYRRKVLIQ